MIKSKIAAVFLFCAGLLCLAQAQVPMTGAGKGAPGGGAACAGFSIDGAATSQPATGTMTSTQTITTTQSNEVIFSIVTVNGGPGATQTTTDNSGVTAAWTSSRATGGLTSALIYESWTTASAPLVSKTITTTYSATTAFIETIVFGVIGGKISAPFDTGGASNVPQTSTGAAVSININAINSLALGFSRNSNDAGPQSTWTQIAAAANFTLVQFKAFSSQQTGLSVSDPGMTPNGQIGDALVCGP